MQDQRPSVCNAIETILVHQKVAPEFYQNFKIFKMYKSMVMKKQEKS
ncbi:MAG: hypothetical protein ACLR43_07670 [Faecalibacillus faecis]